MKKWKRGTIIILVMVSVLGLLGIVMGLAITGAVVKSILNIRKLNK